MPDDEVCSVKSLACGVCFLMPYRTNTILEISRRYLFYRHRSKLWQDMVPTA